MKDMIGYSGLDCETCDAYIATVHDDLVLREKTAKLWAGLNNAPILPEHINCEGCRKIKGEVYWLQYIGAEVCPVYDCCVNDKKHENCGSCEKLPCAKFTKDPTISDEQNEANLKIMTERLRRNK